MNPTSPIDEERRIDRDSECCEKNHAKERLSMAKSNNTKSQSKLMRHHQFEQEFKEQ